MQKTIKHLRSDEILRFLITDSKDLDEMLILAPGQFEFVATDFDVFLALSSVKEYDPFNQAKLKKVFQNVNIMSYKEKFRKDKPIITEEDVSRVRTRALANQGTR